jgi:hypothetical protein
MFIRRSFHVDRFVSFVHVDRAWDSFVGSFFRGSFIFVGSSFVGSFFRGVIRWVIFHSLGHFLGSFVGFIRWLRERVRWIISLVVVGVFALFVVYVGSFHVGCLLGIRSRDLTGFLEGNFCTVESL